MQLAETDRIFIKQPNGNYTHRTRQIKGTIERARRVSLAFTFSMIKKKSRQELLLLSVVITHRNAMMIRIG